MEDRLIANGEQHVNFGYWNSENGRMKVTEDGKSASKISPESDYGHGVVIASRPIRGESVFEVMIDRHGNGWSGSFKVGLLAVPRKPLETFVLPRYSPDYPRSWVWSSARLYHFADQEHARSHRNCEEGFSKINLESLRAGDTFGFHVSVSGEVVFYANRMKQSSIQNVYESCPADMDLFPMVDHYAQGVGTTITWSETNMQRPRNLQYICRRVILRYVENLDCIDSLPLPKSLKHYLRVDSV
jgi:hypothetical protein